MSLTWYVRCVDYYQRYLNRDWAFDPGLCCSLPVGNGSLAAMLSNIPRK